MSAFVFPPSAPTVLAVTNGLLFPVRRVFCVGRNYADHVREMGNDPDRVPPTFFTKPADAVSSSEEIPFPPKTGDFHHEGELVVALGKGGAGISAADALAHVYGYAAGCDLTRRDLQAAAKKSGSPWDMGKGFDYSGPVGPIRPASETGHPTRGAITLSVNGVEKQRGDIGQMIWTIPEVIAFLSDLVRLEAGDLIFTGTPAGVGPTVKGDLIEIAVDGVGKHHFRLI